MSKYVLKVEAKEQPFEDFCEALNEFNKYENSKQSVTLYRVNPDNEKVQLLNNLENPTVLVPLVETRGK